MELIVFALKLYSIMVTMFLLVLTVLSLFGKLKLSEITFNHKTCAWASLYLTSLYSWFI